MVVREKQPDGKTLLWVKPQGSKATSPTPAQPAEQKPEQPLTKKDVEGAIRSFAGKAAFLAVLCWLACKLVKLLTR